ncbi:MAG: glycosyltransferase family A protein [Pseudomonadota bacterium]
MPITDPVAGQPAVTVVLLSCGRLELLDRCLEALLRQSLPGHAFEVVVVDEHPASASGQLVATWRASCARDGPAILYLATTGPHGAAAARNRGWRRAQAPLVAFTSTECVPSSGWLQQGLAVFDEHTDVLCGRIEELPAGAVAKESDNAAAIGINCFCRRSVLLALNGFDERFRLAWRDDHDLYFRLLAMRARIVRTPRAMVQRRPRQLPWGASLTQLRRSEFDALLYKKHPRRYRQKLGSASHWGDCAAVAALLLALSGAAAGSAGAVLAGASAWSLLTLRLFRRRLRDAPHGPSRLAEVALTSALIPPLALFWRLAGAIRYRVRFAG